MKMLENKEVDFFVQADDEAEGFGVVEKFDEEVC